MLTVDNTVLLIVDVQGKLAHLMHEKKHLFENITKMIKGAQSLDVPILLAEQNPAGLGPTIPELIGLFPVPKPSSKQPVRNHNFPLLPKPYNKFELTKSISQSLEGYD